MVNLARPSSYCGMRQWPSQCMRASLELQDHFWQKGVYQDVDNPNCPLTVLPLSSIDCQLAGGAFDTLDPPIWVTTTLSFYEMRCNTRECLCLSYLCLSRLRDSRKA